MGNKKAVLDMDRQNKIDNRLFYFIAISIFLITFIIRIKKFTFYYDYDFQRLLGAVFNTFTYYRLISLVILFLVGLAIYIYRCVKYHIKFQFNAVTMGILLIIISSLISTLFTEMTKEAFWGFYTRTNGLLAYLSLFGLFLITSKINIAEKQLRFLAHGINTVSFIIITIGIMEFFGIYLYGMNWFRNIYIPSELRSIISIWNTFPKYIASSTLGQPNYFGGYCSIIFPFITVQAIDSKKMFDKILFSVGSVFLFVGTYISVSMGPWITLLAILVLFLITYKHWKSYIHIIVLLSLYALTTVFFAKYEPSLITDSIQVVKAAFLMLNYKLLLLVLPIVLVMIVYYKYQNINKYKFISILVIISILVTMIGFVYVLTNVTPRHMEMLSNRGYVWHYSYEMLKQNYIIGYGPDTFFYNFPQDNPDYMIYSPNTRFDKPHNMYLQVFIDNGLFGIAGFMILLVSSLLITLKSTYTNEKLSEVSYSKAIFFVIIAYMIQGITNDNNMGIQPIVYLMIATGIAISRDKNKMSSKIQ
jgi:hypothetical protein